MIELKELFKAGVHFGHRTSRWAPQMAPYIWGSKNKMQPSAKRSDRAFPLSPWLIPTPIQKTSTLSFRQMMILLGQLSALLSILQKFSTKLEQRALKRK